MEIDRDSGIEDVRMQADEIIALGDMEELVNAAEMLSCMIDGNCSTYLTLEANDLPNLITPKAEDVLRINMVLSHIMYDIISKIRKIIN